MAASLPRAGVMFAACPWNGSYRLGFDHRFTHEESYFFTFYSEFGDRGWEGWIEAGLLGTALLVSVVTNSLLVLSLISSRQRTVTNSFLASLWAADSLFALGIPAVISARINPAWALGNYVCRILPYSQLVCGFAVLWSLTFISVERYRCLTLDPRLQTTVCGARFLVSGTWLVGLLVLSPSLFWFHYDHELSICTLMFPRAPPFNVALVFTLAVTLVSCLLPMAILVFNYQRILVKIMESRERWSRPCVQTSSLTRQEQQRIKKHIRIMRTVLVNVTVVLLMWLPVAAVLVLIYVDGNRPLSDTGFFLRSHHFVSALLLALVNTAVNPLLSGALRWSGCSSRNDSTPSLSRILRLGSSVN